MNNTNNLNAISKKWNMIFIAILACVALLVLIPLILVVVISFTGNESIADQGYRFIPQQWSLEGYKHLFKMGDQLIYSYLITIAYSVAGTLIGTFFMSMYAYVLIQKQFRCRRILIWFAFFTMLFSGGLVPSYILNVRYYHIKNTFWILLLPGLVSAYLIIILRTFMKTTIPDSLFEAARLDGAGHFTIFFRIVLPLSKAGLATVGLFSFVTKWNDWFTGMLYITNNKLVPLQTLLTKLQNNVDYLTKNAEVLATDEGMALLSKLPSASLRMACCIMVILPVLFAYPFFQRYFINGLTVGSIKE